MHELAYDIKNGSEKAFHIFFTRMYGRVILYLNKTLFDNRFADDIAQEAFIRLWQYRHRIDPDQPLEAWLFTIVKNTAITYIQKLLSERKHLRQTKTGQEALNSSLHVDNEGLSNLHYQDSLSTYHKALETLTPERLHCFRLHREEGLTYHQIAETQGLSVKTVEKHISSVIRILREAMPQPYGIVGISLLFL